MSVRLLVLIFAVLAAPAHGLDAVILSPSPGETVFGEVEFAVEVVPEEEVAEVRFRVDGREVGRRERPPWRVRVDVGEENAEHRFEVEAVAAGGEVARALLVTPPIRVDLEVDLDLRQLYVTATRDGERVLDLERDDFAVYDDGARQELVTFERGDVPLVATLLVDASDSMRGDRLETAVAGAGAFVTGMAPLDQARLLLFSDRIVHGTPFTNFTEVLRTGLLGVEAGGSTALNDHLYLALRLLEERQGRRVVVLLSDGVDVASVLDMEDVAGAAARSQALLYWIRLGAPDPRGAHSSAWRDAENHRRQLRLLERTIETSGGRVLTLNKLEDTAEAFAQILHELRDQYVLGYYPRSARHDGVWHRVEVRVRGRGLRVRTREGYFDE
jgi:VWFA-related protein